MVLEEPIDFGGESIRPQDLISDDLICKIKGLNPNLGRPMDAFGNGDPFYEHYAKYRDEIENAELIIIDANALNRSSIMNLDLTGNVQNVVDLPFDYFQLVSDTMMPAYGRDEFGLEIDFSSVNSDSGFEEFTSWGETEYSPFSDGNY